MPNRPAVAAARTPAPASSLPRWRIWMMAARVPTLSAAITPVLVGSAAAWSQGSFLPGVLVAAMIASILIQVGTNFANDLFDYKRGADTEQRTGPTRVTQAGLLTPGEVERGMWLTFGLAVIAGIYLIAIGGWPVLLIGILSIAAGILYTAGPWPLAYHGLGDLFTFIFFGLVAVSGTYYVHTGQLDARALAASLPVGCIVTAILVANNLRDIETDEAAGKRTLAVRLGERNTQIQYILLLLVAYLTPVAMWAAGWLSSLFWLPWLTLPLALRLVRIVQTQKGRELIPALKGTGLLHLLFGLLFAASLLW